MHFLDQLGVQALARSLAHPAGTSKSQLDDLGGTVVDVLLAVKNRYTHLVGLGQIKGRVAQVAEVAVPSDSCARKALNFHRRASSTPTSHSGAAKSGPRFWR